MGVNWFFRSADVKLGKGASIEALLPDKVFYLFDLDDILGALLLHPYEVEFLSKGHSTPHGSFGICV